MAQAEPRPAAQPEPPKPEKPVERGNLPNFVATLSLSENGPALEEFEALWRLVPLETSEATTIPEDRTGSSYAVEAPPGLYRLTARLGAATVVRDIMVEPGKDARPRLVLNAGIVTVVPKRIQTDEKADERIEVELRGSAGARDRGQGETSYVVPAGTVGITARLGKAEVVETIALKPGETLRHELVVNVARLRGRAMLAEGMAPISGDSVKFSVQPEDRAHQRGSMAHAYGGKAMVLRADRYVLRAKYGKVLAQSPAFALAPDEDRTVDVILNAGYMSVSDPGAIRIHVRAGEGMENAGREVSRGRGPDFRELLPAGRYIARLVYGENQQKELPFEIIAGKETRLAP